MAKSRIGFVDVARGIAMICIFLGHIRIKAINPFVYSFNVPVFLLISGYFISRKTSVKAFALRRFRAIMVPYFVTCTVIVLLAALLGLRTGTALSEIKKWVLASVYGSGTTYQKPFAIQMIGPIWFLPATCIAAILFRCVLELPEKLRALAVGVLFAAGYLSSTRLFWFPMSIQAGFCAVLFLYIGWLFRENEEYILGISKETKIAAVLTGLLLWSFFVADFPGFYVVRNFYGDSPADVLCSVCGCGLVILFSWYIDKKTRIISRLLRFVGHYSLLVLCVHAVEQNLVKWNQIFARFVILPGETIKYILIVLKPASVLIVVWLLLKIPFIRRLFGYDRVNA